MPLQRPRYPGVARPFPKFLGFGEPEIRFWPRFHAFPRGGMRACKANPLLCTCGFDAGVTDSHAHHSGVHDSPELRVYSRLALGLANLGFHFGRVFMSFLEVACVRAGLTHWFVAVPQSAVGVTLTHTTLASVISRSCASIPEFPCI